MTTYTTKSGDTWDGIAKQMYGMEVRADLLFDANPKLVEIWQFDSGTEITVPDLPDEKNGFLPPWKYES